MIDVNSTNYGVPERSNLKSFGFRTYTEQKSNNLFFFDINVLDLADTFLTFISFVVKANSIMIWQLIPWKTLKP